MSKFYLILLQYVKPVNAIEHYLETHKAFLHKYGENGHFLLSGKKHPEVAGSSFAKPKTGRKWKQSFGKIRLTKTNWLSMKLWNLSPFILTEH